MPITENISYARWRNFLLLLGVCLLLVIIDQTSKVWAVQRLKNEPAVTVVSKEILVLTYAENSGAFLSLGSGLSPSFRFLLLSLSNGILLGGLLVYLFVNPQLKWFWWWGCLLLLAGGTGNLIDRLFNDGRVIDFLFMKYGPVQTGIFNVADLYITAGFLWLGFFSLKQEWQERQTRSSESSEERTEFSSANKPLLKKRLDKKLLLTIVVAAIVTSSHHTWADQVIYRVNDRGAQAALTGEILEYTADKMEFRVKTPDTIHHISESSILSFQAYLLPDHQKAIEALQTQKFSEAYQLAEKAIDQERRPWVRRELWAIQVQVSVNQQQWSTAGKHFRQMLVDHPQTRQQDLAPLFWIAHPLSPDDALWAERELNSSLPLIQLTAASWLLEDELYGKKATKILEEFLYSPEPMIRGWARCLLWRNRLREKDFNEGELPRWETQLQDLPVSMRAGPMLILAEGYEQLVQPQRAAACYLWIPLEDPRRFDLTVTALERGANLLEKIGQEEQAWRLREEARLRFGLKSEKLGISSEKQAP